MKHCVWILGLVFFAGCSRGPIQVESVFDGVSQVGREKMWVLTATPGEGAGKLLQVNFKDRQITEASHRVDSDPLMAAMPKSKKLLVFNRKSRGGTLVFDENLNLETNYNLVPEMNFPNFQDAVEIKEDEAYVSSHEANVIFHIQISTGEVLRRIELDKVVDPEWKAPPSEVGAAEPDTDGLVEPTKFVRFGEKVAILLQRLNRDKGFIPSAYSSIVVVDPASHQVDGYEIRLGCKNPGSIEHITDTDVMVACQGSFASPGTGAVEIVSLSERRVKEQVLSGETLKGNPSLMVSASRFLSVFLVLGEAFQTSLFISGIDQAKAITTERPYESGFRSLLLDLERRLVWAGSAGKTHHVLEAISLDDYSVMATIPLELTPQQLLWASP